MQGVWPIVMLQKKPVQPADPLAWFKYEENKEGSINRHSDAGISLCLTKSLWDWHANVLVGASRYVVMSD